MFFSGLRRTRELEERLSKAERELVELRLDWETTLDKVHRWMQRTSARARTEAREEAATVDGGNGGRQQNTDPISARILARRARTPLDRTHVETDEEER